MKIDFDHITGQGIADETLSNMHEERELTIIEKLKPEFSKDGNQYCYLYGENLQTGIAGFGSTVSDAVSDFCRNYYGLKA